MRLLAFVFMFVSSVCCVAQEPHLSDLRSLPRIVQPKVKDYQRDIEKARETFSEAVARAGKELHEDLETSMRRAMNSRDADAVVEIQRLLDGLQKSNVAQEPQIPDVRSLPRNVQPKIKEYRRDIARSRKEFSEAVARTGKKLQEDLATSMRRAMNSNDADTVVGIQRLLDRVQKSNEDASLASGWKVVFRGVTGERFNTDTPLMQDGTFAISLTDDTAISHVRLANLRTQQSVVVRCDLKVSDLASVVELGDGWIWNGTAKKFTGSKGQPDFWQLGLANKKWQHGYGKGATIAGPKYGYGGYGFGRLNHVNNHHGTQYLWADVTMPKPFALEVSVTSMLSITDKDGAILNKSPGVHLKNLLSTETQADAITPKSAAASTPNSTNEFRTIVRTRAKISSQSPTGFHIGHLLAGDRITLRYIQGRWKQWGRNPTVSPDGKNQKESGEDWRLETGLAIADAANPERPKRLIVLPYGTAESPYQWSVPTEVENVVLKIALDDKDYAQNPDGGVTYDIVIESRHPSTHPLNVLISGEQ